MCQISSYQWGGVPAILNIICMFIRHESEAQSLSPHYDKKIGKHFSIPSVPSPFVPVSSPGWRVCPHFCWDNLLEYPDFPSLICLKEINGHYCGQIQKNPEFWKHLSFLKKTLSFEKNLSLKKNLSFEKIWLFFKKNPEFWKKSELKKKPWVFKKRAEF